MSRFIICTYNFLINLLYINHKVFSIHKPIFYFLPQTPDFSLVNSIPGPATLHGRHSSGNRLSWFSFTPSQSPGSSPLVPSTAATISEIISPAFLPRPPRSPGSSLPVPSTAPGTVPHSRFSRTHYGRIFFSIFFRASAVPTRYGSGRSALSASFSLSRIEMRCGHRDSHFPHCTH